MSAHTTPVKLKTAKPVCKSTPVQKSLQGSEHYASESKQDADILKEDIAKELTGQWVGPMPVENFIETFLPLAGDILNTKPVFSKTFFKTLVKQKVETAMYDPFIKLVSSSGAIPGFKLVNSSQNEDIDAVTGMKNKPDVSCYSESVVITENRKTRYQEMEVIFEFKPPEAEADPFEDEPEKNPNGWETRNRHPFEPQSEDRKMCRGQIACYARVWSARQHRTHCFIIWIADPSARIIRFDRTGGIVSAKFNYRTHGHILLDFLWRHSKSTPQGRGYDPTVARVYGEDPFRIRDKLYDWKPRSRRGIFELQVPDPSEEDKERTRPILVWGPLADPRSVTGRATRAYPAWDPKGNGGKGGLVFVKDSWRSVEQGLEKETDILKKLNDHRCRNIPQLVCGNDLPGQFTLTKKYANESWNIGASEKNLVSRVHIRFVTDIVGRRLTPFDNSRLTPFDNSREFLQGVYDDFLAHYDAYTKCKILHRDISAGNILFKPEGGGFLNDWDLAKHVDGEQYARQSFRSGTWQFMSVDLLRDNAKLNCFRDDLESFFWIVTYHMVRHMRHNLLTDVQQTMDKVFDEGFEPIPGQGFRGGDAKAALISRNVHVPADFMVLGNKPLTSFFRSVRDEWANWHECLSSHERNVARFASAEDISIEDAKGKVAFYPSHLGMHEGYAFMESAFKKALSPNSLWPESDPSIDHLIPSSKRQRGDDDDRPYSDEEDPATKLVVPNDPQQDSHSTSSDEGGPSKNSKKDQDPDYRVRIKGQTGGPFTSHQTRGQAKATLLKSESTSAA